MLEGQNLTEIIMVSGDVARCYCDRILSEVILNLDAMRSCVSVTQV